MRKLLLVLLMLFTLSSCKKTEKPVKLNSFKDNNFDISKIVSVDCYLGGGSTYSLSDNNHLKAIYDDLLNISIDLNNYQNNLYIDDGDISFNFISEDGTIYTFSFLTSEYYYQGNKYYELIDKTRLVELMYKVRDYSQMELNKYKLEIIDNGCEAKNVLAISDGSNQAYIEGVYEIVYENYEDYGLVLCVKTGDYYNHENIKVYLVNIINGEIEIKDGE